MNPGMFLEFSDSFFLSSMEDRGAIFKRNMELLSKERCNLEYFTFDDEELCARLELIKAQNMFKEELENFEDIFFSFEISKAKSGILQVL